MFNLTKTFNISASHSLPGHVKCSSMHGHNYQIAITVGADRLNSSGMLIDFSEITSKVNKMFERYDHRHLGRIPDGWSPNSAHVVTLPFEHTTAENLAQHWGKEVIEVIKPLKLVKIDVYETPKNLATWIPPED
ncbi:MAG: 6-pyruvoyl trahydropterin synthase family protein [Candidatus Hodarchaeales archaeon]|jgi:6-pyruvoyltetrahydropterin/6-carboxytetrahydropterin synthase